MTSRESAAIDVVLIIFSAFFVSITCLISNADNSSATDDCSGARKTNLAMEANNRCTNSNSDSESNRPIHSYIKRKTYQLLHPFPCSKHPWQHSQSQFANHHPLALAYPISTHHLVPSSGVHWQQSLSSWMQEMLLFVAPDSQGKEGCWSKAVSRMHDGKRLVAWR